MFFEIEIRLAKNFVKKLQAAPVYSNLSFEQSFSIYFLMGKAICSNCLIIFPN